ncbi:hypothetical protein KSP39_PZI014129 [Platanthera zijinensis]|uniref:Uncharacterized protein n=1 Tax=Platanthera zijinensis TaxID=2320716 RepID=A0AAP0G3X5_9ASPA
MVGLPLLQKPFVLCSPDIQQVVSVFQDTFLHKICSPHPQIDSPYYCGEPLNKAARILFPVKENFNPLGMKTGYFEQAEVSCKWEGPRRVQCLVNFGMGLVWSGGKNQMELCPKQNLMEKTHLMQRGLQKTFTGPAVGRKAF